MLPQTFSARPLSPWDQGPRFDLRLRSPLAAAGWTWRTLPPGHPALLASPTILRRNDPGDALGVIAERYGEPTAYCVLGGNVASVSGWEGVTFGEQYAAVTQGAGAFPAGGMFYLSVAGPQAAQVLNLLTPRRIDLLEIGQAAFAIFTTPEGTVDTEGVVLRDGPESFQVSVGGDTRPPTWLHDALLAYPDTHAEETSLSSFNLKGPQRLEAMARLVADEFVDRLTQLTPFRALRVRTRWGADAWILRSVIGIEMWAGPEAMNEAWRRMSADPDCFTPCGWDVLASYRMECPDFAFYLCPLDIHCETYLFDVGLGHVRSKGKPSPYIGREALQNPGQFGGRMWIAGLRADSADALGRTIGERLISDTTEAPQGYVTSTGYSPQAGRELCFAHLSVGVVPASRVRFEDGTTWRVLPLPMRPGSTDDRSL